MKHTSSLSSMTRIRPIKRSPSQAEITRDEFIRALCNRSGYLPTTQRTDRNNSATCWGVKSFSSVYLIAISSSTILIIQMPLYLFYITTIDYLGDTISLGFHQITADREDIKHLLSFDRAMTSLRICSSASGVKSPSYCS